MSMMFPENRHPIQFMSGSGLFGIVL